MSARILFLRILISSWAIPASWLFLFPLFVLLGGWSATVKDIIGFNKFLWNGVQ